MLRFAHRNLVSRPSISRALQFGVCVALTVLFVVALWDDATRAFHRPPAAMHELEIASPRVYFDGRSIVVASAIRSSSREEIKGWFFLSSPDNLEPWNDHVYRSSELERTVPSGDPTVFEWAETAALPPGEYAVSVWFHRRDGDQWIHAGGVHGAADEIVTVIGAGAAEVIAPGTPPSEANPQTGGIAAGTPALVGTPTRSFRLITSGVVPSFEVGTETAMPLAIVGNEPSGCRIEWTLATQIGGRPVTFGESEGCATVVLSLPSTIRVGTYVATMRAFQTSSQGEIFVDVLQVVIEVTARR